ncbi:hypothetical protein G5V59_26180 [Nocardioides sp. W3-2-3]|uniref:hypothetical protein n=1 Tax=Nocardioides convexus TaxID=2712224 RepID=UPI0024189947|nr:hypothetical protein [Nocardioides convexus]NHA01943.1 hypothetical protein [Nocardioides convexus]
MKTEALMVGFNKKTEFAMNSRSRVRINVIELIVKDLLRKQEYLKTDKALPKNAIVNSLKRLGASAQEDAGKAHAPPQAFADGSARGEEQERRARTFLQY